MCSLTFTLVKVPNQTESGGKKNYKIKVLQTNAVTLQELECALISSKNHSRYLLQSKTMLEKTTCKGVSPHQANEE